MNRAQKMLAVLRDHQPHTREEIQQRVGFFLTNNAASELRALGYQIEQHREEGMYVYRLAASGAAAFSNPVDPSLGTDDDNGDATSGRDGETATRDAQPELRTAQIRPRRPVAPGSGSASPSVDGGVSGVPSTNQLSLVEGMQLVLGLREVAA